MDERGSKQIKNLNELKKQSAMEIMQKQHEAKEFREQQISQLKSRK